MDYGRGEEHRGRGEGRGEREGRRMVIGAGREESKIPDPIHGPL